MSHQGPPNQHHSSHGQFQDQNMFNQQQHQQQHSYEQQQLSSYNASLNPAEFDIKRERSPIPNQEQQEHHQPQFTDYPLFSDDKSGLYPVYDNVPTTQAGGINPADLSLSMGHSPHHSHDASLQMSAQHSPMMGSDNYLSTTQPPATTVDWAQLPIQSNPWGHRRAPSEYSDISSAAPSPYMPHQDYNDSPSPLIAPQNTHRLSSGQSMQDLLRTGGPGEAFPIDLESFSLNDHSPNLSHSPALHSSANSPYLLPSDPSLPIISDTGMHQLHSPPTSHPSDGLGIVTTTSPDSQPAHPQINISFAPPQRQPTFPNSKDPDNTALSPPVRSAMRRQRSKSDPYANGAHPGPPTHSHRRQLSGSGAISRSPSPHARSRRNSLSPVDIPHAGSRTPSPAGQKMSRRNSTNSLTNREAILDLAHPNRPGAGSSESKRVQKHAATYACGLCPKKFTRAYNLRSHLRTHTDERPFVCSICQKAFARQHDRKRHEGLHSGEKKFVCKGSLKDGGSWGCSRRFARADALGRHFKSEAGRVCIRPLLEEEQRERLQKGLVSQAEMLGAPPGGVVPVVDGAVLASAFPSVLLSQFPMLANMDFGVGPVGGDDYEDEGDFDQGIPGGGGVNSHRSSWDGSGWVSDQGDMNPFQQQGQA